MMLVINMEAAGEHRYRLTPIICHLYLYLYQFLRCLRDLLRVPIIRENYHRVSRIRENRVPRIREIWSLQVHTGYLTCSLKKTVYFVET